MEYLWVQNANWDALLLKKAFSYLPIYTSISIILLGISNKKPKFPIQSLYNSYQKNITKQFYTAPMTTTTSEYDENQQSLQFYKIKLMEKEREISDFAAKMKKIQFKNNRDVKELKMAEQKAKLQLKQQKQKMEKMVKTMTQATEQNNVLQHRLNQLKQQKDKEIESTRAQYNHLKTEVRSYERILPTHTFMSKFGFNYEQLPTYEHLFMNLKERTDRYEELEEKFKKYKSEVEEKLDMQGKVNESLQKKKAELQKQLRDDLTKLLDIESQMTTVTCQRQQLRNKTHDLSQQLLSATQTNQQLTQTNKTLQSKIQQLIRIYHSDLQAKQQQIQKITEEQFRKYEDQIQRITRAYEAKENSHLQQLAYFEEEEHRLNERIQKDKEKFQENYREIYGEVEKIKKELDAEKEESWKQKQQHEKQKQQLNIKTAQCYEYLQKLGENQVRIEELMSQVKSLEGKLALSRDQSNEKYGSVVEEKKNLTIRVKQLQEELNEVREELSNKQSQLQILLHQLEQLKHKSSPHIAKGNSLYHANGIESQQLDTIIRNRSNTEQSQLQKVGPMHQIHISSVKVKGLRSRQDSLLSQKSQQRKISVSMFTQEQVDARVADSLREFQREMDSKVSKKIADATSALEHQLKEKHSEQINSLVKQHRKQVNQLKKKQQEFQNKLKKIYQQHETDKFELNQSITKLTRKYDMLKMQKQTLQANYIEHINEAKRDKEGINTFRAQNRQLEKTIKQHVKNIEGLNVQLQVLRKYKQRAQAKENKQKSVSSESSSNNMKEIIEKYSAQVTRLMEEKQQEIRLHQSLQEQIKTLKREVEDKGTEIEGLKAEIENKNREVKMLDDLLDHEKKDRTLRTVPSLASLPDQDGQQQQNFKQFYNQAGQKQGQILLLEREVAELKNQIQELKQKHEHKIAGLDQQMNGYIQEIIEMKLKCANAEMKASEKTHLYNQLKKKFNVK